jgi:integrase
MKKTNSGLPLGVTERKDRPGLYQMRVQVNGKRYSEDYRATETSKKKLQSELQKAIDGFKERIERGQLKSGDITDKSTFSQAVKWFKGIRKLELRESSLMAECFAFERYLIPRLGSFKLKEITSPIVTKLLAELLEKGGGNDIPVYSAKPEFIQHMNDTKPSIADGGFNGIARELNIGVDNTIRRIRRGGNCEKKIADKIAKYYGVSLSSAFDKKIEVKPLSASYVSRIAYVLSALFTACIKNGILTQNPVSNATKPRIGEMDIPPYLDNTQIPIFLNVLNNSNIDNSIRVAITLMLMLGLRSGEARGLRWCDIDYNSGVVSIEKNCEHTVNGLALTDLKTKRSRWKLPLSLPRREILINHTAEQERYSTSISSLWQDNDLICPNTTGGLMNHTMPNKVLKRIVNANKELPRGLHAHSMRHSFVSLLISNGLDLVTVAALAGDTIEIISRHYAHSFAERRASAMDVIGASFAGVLQNPIPIRLAAVNE